MVCKTLQQMKAIAEVGAKKIWHKGSGYKGQEIGVNAYELTSPAGETYEVITFPQPSCTCPFFAENYPVYGHETVCKHLVAAEWHEEITSPMGRQ